MKKYILLISIVISNCTYNKNREHYNIFCYNEATNITSLDPAYARSLSNIWAVNQIFNGLVQLDSTLKVIPCIAKSWDISEDGKTYTFHLRGDVFFHEDESVGNKRNVVAQDFVYSFTRITNQKTASPGNWIFQNVIRNHDEQPAFNALNDTTFEISLSEAFPPFLGLLAMQYCSVLPREAVERYGVNFRNHPVGTGPFKFAYWKENVKLVLVKNCNYFEKDIDGKPLPYLDAVNITFIVDRQTAFMDFLKGNIHFISGIDASYKDALLDKKGKLKEQFREKINLQSVPFLNTEYLGFYQGNERTGHPICRNKLIRKALNYSIDKKKLIHYLRNGIGYPGNEGFIPPAMYRSGSKATIGYEYNPEKAKELLAEAGFPNGRGLPPLTLTTTSAYLDICQFVQHEAKKTGINILIETTPSATLREMIAKGKLDFFRASWVADYPDAENYLSLFYSKNFSPVGPNYTHYRNNNFDANFENAIQTYNDSVRFKKYQELDSILTEDAPVLVLYYDQIVRFIRKEVKGIPQNPMNLLVLKYAKFTKNK